MGAQSFKLHILPVSRASQEVETHGPFTQLGFLGGVSCRHVGAEESWFFQESQRVLQIVTRVRGARPHVLSQQGGADVSRHPSTCTCCSLKTRQQTDLPLQPVSAWPVFLLGTDTDSCVPCGRTPSSDSGLRLLHRSRLQNQTLFGTTF